MKLTSGTSLFRRGVLAAIFFCVLAPEIAVLAQEPAIYANPGTIPTDRLSESWWADRHKAVLTAVHDHPDTQLLLIGDSITNNYDKANPPDENF